MKPRPGSTKSTAVVAAELRSQEPRAVQPAALFCALTRDDDALRPQGIVVAQAPLNQSSAERASASRKRPLVESVCGSGRSLLPAPRRFCDSSRGCLFRSLSPKGPEGRGRRTLSAGEGPLRSYNFEAVYAKNASRGATVSPWSWISIMTRFLQGEARIFTNGKSSPKNQVKAVGLLSPKYQVKTVGLLETFQRFH
jgi:hypothetical protein